MEHYDFRVEQGDITVCTVTAVEHAVTTVEQFDTTVSMVTPQWITVTAKLTTLSPQWSMWQHNEAL